MGHVDVAGVRYELPDGRVLLDDVSFRVGDGAKVALVGANGAGKTTLLRIITGQLTPHAGAVTRSGGLGVMRQAVGHGLGEDPTVGEPLVDQTVPPAGVVVSPAVAEQGRHLGQGLRCAVEGLGGVVRHGRMMARVPWAWNGPPARRTTVRRP